MMDIANNTTPETIKRIFEHYQNKRKGEHRPHLGGSQIGRECDRALWYQFRWAWTPHFEGRMLRLFETGDREEDRVVRNLRDVGVTVWDRDPDTGRQVRFEACGGHFALSLDGVGENFPESKKPHTLEFKTMNTKSFRKLSEDGLEKSNAIYWAQCQIGMHLSKLERCYFFAVCKETDAIYGERIRYDPAQGIKLEAKANRIVFAPLPPPRITEDPSDWRCKFCPYFAVCQGNKIPEVHCRTCAHVTPENNGSWSCSLGNKVDKPCANHLFIPQMMPKDLEVKDAGTDWVDYLDQLTGQTERNKNNSQAMFEGRMK
jgi:hypothetical protein